ncbi:MAG TPA: ATP synthase F0 subunit B [Bryobacteraceae bacterium]|nr:ATP synthase F0 subunit B [Bryobacteraceae bacterium]
MKRLLPSCLLLVALSGSLLLAQHGAEGGEHAAGGSSNELLWKWANFAILAGALGYLVYKNAGAFFRSRTEAIRKGIEEADRLRRDAEDRAGQMEERLKNLENEVRALRASAEQEMTAEKERLRRETDEALRKIREHSEQEIASAVKTARHEVRAEAAELALRLAAEKIRARISPQVDQGLVESVLSDIEKQAGGSRRKEVN